MNKILLPFLVLFLAATAPAQPKAASGKKASPLVSELRCEYLVDPAGMDRLNPRLSWIIEAPGVRGWNQTAYQILVASRVKNLDANLGDLWDTHKVESDGTSGVEYKGKPLLSRMRCYWKVRVWDRNGRPSKWSQRAEWTVGLTKPEDWKAQWIGAEPVVLNGERAHDSVARQMSPSPLLRKTFKSPKQIARAMLYVTALGLYEVRLNGVKVGSHELAPEWTDYQKRIQYQAYDVTRLLKVGQNALGAMLADGWYIGAMGNFADIAANRGKNYSSLDRKLMLQLEIEPAGAAGKPLRIVTDESWRINPEGPVRSADLYLGETYDRRKLPEGWDQPLFNDSGWGQASVYPPVMAALIAQTNEPVRVVQDLRPVSLSEPVPGTYIFDMGQNMVGWCATSIDEPAGKEVRIRYGEALDDSGFLYTANLRRALQTDLFISDGKGPCVYEPRFTYHGFRFVEITGWTRKPALSAVLGKAVSSDVKETGEFECSNPLVNQLWKNIRWTQRDNLIGIPTDCPQRDERLGWMADAQVFSQTAMLNSDMSAFYTKWAQDIRDAQNADGRYPDVAPMPEPLKFYNAPGWADAGVILPWRMYQNYGDTLVLREHYSSAKRFVDFLHSVNPHLVWTEAVGNMYGDWLNGNTIVSKEYPSTGGQVPQCIFSTMYFAYSARLLSQMAEVLGYTEDAFHYGRLAREINDTLLVKFVSPDGAIMGNTQAGYALALGMGFLPDSLQGKAFMRMLDCLADYDFRISTGFLSTVQMMNELSRRGSSDVAYGLLESRRFPSWLYEITQGATTVWERWDGYVKGRGFQDPGMNSFNHYAIGSVGEWMYRSILGIQPDDAHPGYRHFFLIPQIGGSLTWAKGKYHSINGDIACSWRLDSAKARLHVEIPANTTARVFIPTDNPQSVREGGKPARQSAGVRVEGTGDRAVICDLEPGSYDFETAYAKPVARSFTQKPVIRASLARQQGGSVEVSLTCPDTSLAILYSLSTPGQRVRPEGSAKERYTRPLALSSTSVVTAWTARDEKVPSSYPAQCCLDFEGGGFCKEYMENALMVHAAYGCSVQYASPFSQRRPGRGPLGLVNGKQGSLDFDDPEWQGFEGAGMEASVDLGRELPVTQVSAGFLSYQSVRVFLPTRVEFFTSPDGVKYTQVASLDQSPEKNPVVYIRRFSAATPGTTCRYVKVVAKGVGQCPDWHRAKGEKAWTLVDEIVVR